MSPYRATYEVAPATGPLTGEVTLPGSKSLTNRALCLASLADGVSRLDNPLLSDDTLYMVAGLKNLGFQIRKRELETFITVQGGGGILPWNEGRIWAGSAGTVLRFILGILPLGQGRFIIDGDAHLRKRPIRQLVEALRTLGATIDFLGAGGKELPLEVRGEGGLVGGKVSLAGGTSSQFLSALLMAGPCMAKGVEVSVEGELASKPYADMTLQAMDRFGISVQREGYSRFQVLPGTYAAGRIPIEGDASAATYFLACAAVCGGRVRVKGVGKDSLQGDTEFASVLGAMGAEIQMGPDWIEVKGPVKTG
ncbi:MAG: 3-phosphoshikimate 1-carboxyvinyltransferase, partial [Planctomycetota bacterium]